MGNRGRDRNKEKNGQESRLDHWGAGDEWMSGTIRQTQREKSEAQGRGRVERGESEHKGLNLGHVLQGEGGAKRKRSSFGNHDLVQPVPPWCRLGAWHEWMTEDGPWSPGWTTEGRRPKMSHCEWP